MPRPYNGRKHRCPCRGEACLALQLDAAACLFVALPQIQESALLPPKGSRALNLRKNYSVTAVMPSMMMEK